MRMRQLDFDNQLKLKELELNNRLKMKELELRELELKANSVRAFDLSRQMHMVPKFNEAEPDSFFQHFEKTATQCKWPKEQWSALVQSALVNKGQKVYAALSLQDSLVYDKVKEHVLKAYELVPEAYRKRFRELKNRGEESFLEFARNKRILFEKWCASQSANSLDDLRELILMEDFKSCVSPSICVYLSEQRTKTLNDAATLADDYLLYK